MSYIKMEDKEIVITPGYLAGVLDSDGSLSIVKNHVNKRPNPSYTASIQLTWTKTDKSVKVIEKLKQMFGGSSFETKIHEKSLAKKPGIKYQASVKSVEKILDFCGEHIILKSKQVENIKELSKLKFNRIHTGGTGNFRTKELSEKYENLFISNKECNTKNVYKNAR